jgi:predicted AlkP superfamily pyrophosphatase or phosphodiesterase
MKHTLAASRRAVLCILLLSLTISPALARTNAPPQTGGASQRARAGVAAAETRPRLVLVVVVDQFRYDFLERFGDLFTGGLRRLQQEGASWTQTNYDHIPTETAPGHATLLTGAWPAETGIIGNEWYDRGLGRRVSNVSDESAQLLGGAAGQAASSPRRLLVSTLGDELRLASQGRSKVVGISVKDRAAILTVGRQASAAYWFNIATGNMVSSTYYFNRLPAWVERFNAARPVDKFFGARWERLLPEAEYVRRAGADDAPWERAPGATAAPVFPHVVTGGLNAPGREFYDAVNYSPYSNEMLVSFAEQALTNEQLGADADTDVLSVSFSANDYVGHRYGPYSHEAMDMTLRVDRQIAALLDMVERRVGLRHTLVAFTADHGVSPVPEHAASLNLPGGRVRISDLTTAVKNGLRARFAKGEGDRDNTADYILSYTNESFYFNPVALTRDGVSLDEAARVAGEAGATVPGISRFFTRAQLERGAISPADAVARRALHGFHARRSGDVLFVQEPYKYLLEGFIAATHGAPYTYDTHVPLIIMGAGVRPGRYMEAATPADLAPTLAALLRVQPPSNSMGRVLVEALNR